jgi:hypothetical protein
MTEISKEKSAMVEHNIEADIERILTILYWEK